MNWTRLIKPIQYQSILKICNARRISQHPIKFLESQDRLREKDGVSKQWQLIYKAPMDKILQFASAYLTFSAGTVSAGLLYYSAFVYDPTTLYEPVVLGEDVVIASNVTEFLIYLGAFVLFHVAVKILLSKYVVRLYQNGDKYLAIYRGNMFNSIIKHEFHLEEFKKLNPTMVVTWGDARFALGKKKGILLEDYFKTPEHFHNLLHKKSKNSHSEDEN